MMINSKILSTGYTANYQMAMAQDPKTNTPQPNRQPNKDDPGSAPESGDKMPEKQ